MAGDSETQPLLTGATLVSAADFDVRLAESIVLVFDETLVPGKGRMRRARRGRHPFRSVGSLADGVDIVVTPGPGAPVAAVTVEFLAAFGVTQLISVGTAGKLTPDGPKTRVVGRAVSDEGTSGHYGANLEPSAGLTASLLSVIGGSAATTATTDVPFRQTPDKLRSHRAVADLIEMECAAIFSAAHAFGIQAAALLVTSDVFGERDWSRSDPVETQLALTQAVDTAVHVLAQSR